MNTLILGQATEYPREYAPGVLYPIARAVARSRLGPGAALPFRGKDIWNAWELTWLDGTGKPIVATATITLDAGSPNIVESKSLKLYLNAFAMTRYDSAGDIEALIAADLSRAAGAEVAVSVSPGPQLARVQIRDFPGSSVDSLPFSASRGDVDAGLLRCRRQETVAETLHSHLLRSLCPVTNQPDFGSVLVRYTGPRIEPASLLEYVVSFREHNDFHETCVERMFLDIKERCAPEKLTVYARYNRRGGIDINSFRSDCGDEPDNIRLWRQ